jgi:hypothetical protein
MKNVIQLVSLQLNDKSMVDKWKIMSDHISAELKNADGFIYRDSAIGEDGTVYCILKWESQEKIDAFQKVLESDEFKENMVEFAKIANVETMKNETLKVF